MKGGPGCESMRMGVLTGSVLIVDFRFLIRLNRELKFHSISV